MKYEGVEVKCPKCNCDGILREGVDGTCLDCGHEFNLDIYLRTVFGEGDNEKGTT